MYLKNDTEFLYSPKLLAISFFHICYQKSANIYFNTSFEKALCLESFIQKE
jgi:hypothetical protein